MSSTQHSRIVHIETRSMLSRVLVSGEEAYTVDPPMIVGPGKYRADLDPATRTATVSLIALTPEETP